MREEMKYSNTILQMYESSDRAEPLGFQSQLVELLSRHIAFDGAALLSGHTERDHSLVIARASIFGREPSLLHDYRNVVHDDPMAEALIHKLHAPISYNCPAFYKKKKLPSLYDVATRHHINHRLFFGCPPSSSAMSQWISLYRRKDEKFERRDAIFLYTIWPHISRALTKNFESALHIARKDVLKQSLAVITVSGHIEYADPEFAALVSREWPDAAPFRLPKSAMSQLIQARAYKGTAVNMQLRSQLGTLICYAKTPPASDRLSVTENKVVEHFIDGKNHVEIASLLGTSPHTVRNQLANSYRKLGIHDKLSLVKIYCGL